MKFEKWTVGLAAVGLVSLASVAKAEEKANVLQTALSSTTISGYVDTSAQWNFGTGNANNPPYRFGGPSKADGFNLNVVQLRIEKPLDEAEWAAGYRFDMWAGPDANVLASQSNLSDGAADFAIRQAYVALRMPVRNGIDWKIGVFDSIIGYESVESPSNPNFTRSYGHTIEPTTHTGVLASYRFNEMFRASAGVANTMGPAINGKAQEGSLGFPSGVFGQFNDAALGDPGENPYAESYKTYMGAVEVTAPESMGFLSGSTFYAGVVNGYDSSVLGSGAGAPHQNYYLGGTFATPVSGLRLGASWDMLRLKTDYHFNTGGGADVEGDAWSLAGYASYQATEKLSLHGRLEYLDAHIAQPDFPGEQGIKALGTTLTVQYDLWQNVLSRLELRWDHSLGGEDLYGGKTAGDTELKNAWMLAGNIVYKF